MIKHAKMQIIVAKLGLVSFNYFNFVVAVVVSITTHKRSNMAVCLDEISFRDATNKFTRILIVRHCCVHIDKHVAVSGPFGIKTGKWWSGISLQSASFGNVMRQGDFLNCKLY